MSEQNPPGDPFEFLKKMWGPMGQSLPGMVTPTLDVNEIEKRINELKSVENWLSMNINMLKMTIQGLEMQKATLMAFQAMGTAAQQHANAPTGYGAGLPGGMPAWPWTQTAHTEAPPDESPPDDAPKPGKPAAKK